MRRRVLVLVGLAALAAGGGVPTAAQRAPSPQSADVPSAPSREIFDRYCVSCHNQRMKTAGLLLDQVQLDDISRHAPALEKVVRKLRAGEMPPEGRPRPDRETLDRFVASLESALDRTAARAPNPGRVASRRLNRVEYVNAIQDLIGLEIDGAALLPSDMAGFGFDNNADVLAITPSLMARYAAAATKISRAAVGSPDNRPIQQLYSLAFEQQDARMSEEMPFASHGGLAVRHLFPLDGEYQFTIRMKYNGSGGGGIIGVEEEHEIELRLDHALLKRFTVGGKYKAPDPGTLIPVPEDDLEGKQIHEYHINADQGLDVRVPVKAGSRLVAVAFSDASPSPLEGAYGRPGIDRVFVSGPFNGTVPQETPSRQRIFVCRPTSARQEEPCARKIMTALTRRAYRRPITDSDVEPLLAVYREGRQARDFDAGIERALEALLSMPEFLLRIEREPAGAGPERAYRLSDFELASRVSFFLWRSVPDEPLLEAAARGQLKDETVLAQQVRRMLADPRATRFMNDFIGQWLEVRNIHGVAPDGAVFAGFNDTLRKAMLRETELFFESQVREDRPIQDLLRADYTYLNEKLARHYREPGVYGSRFRRVTLTDDRRHGLLGHASVLTVTSYANRTSVVLRGKWVLENLLGSPPPPPPPNVPPLANNDAAKPTSLRERMQQHRASATCASCHSKMDPLGFALEHFDGIGRWRETDGGAAINANVTLDGANVDSMKAFREALLARRNEFVQTVTEKLMTYALGRGLEYFDAPVVRQMVRDVEHDGYRWSSLVLAVVRSAPFQMRRVKEMDDPVRVAAVERK
jgi:mono/diheme cytochrome c family protein